MAAKEPVLVADGARWRKVTGAKTWRPGAGEVLIGEYVGRRMKSGSSGIYDVFAIKTDKGVFEVSGAVLRNLFDGSCIAEGTQVRIVFLGYRQGHEHDYKDFELFVLDEKRR